MSTETETEAGAEMLRGHFQDSGAELRGSDLTVSNCSSSCGPLSPGISNLAEQMVTRENLIRAYNRVCANKGAPGIDGRSVDDLKGYLQEHWPDLKQQLLNGTFKPSPVLRVEIPKPDGGMRPLGIPTVLDRLIQQALHQVLSPVFEPDFSSGSYGYRPNKSAHDAVKAAQNFQRDGYGIVVDIDLKSFFDEVNHDILIGLIRKRIFDQRIIRLIRSYLQSGIMIGGVCNIPVKGTPQGGPLSPLLSNIMLNELDQELESRGHRFCRYADDCNIYVKSRRSGERVLYSVSQAEVKS